MTATWCRTAPAGIVTPASLPTAASSGPPVRTTSGAAIGPALVRTPETTPPVMSRPVKLVRSSTRTPLMARACA